MIRTLAIDTGIEPEYENRLIASATRAGWRVIYPRRVPFTDEILDVSEADLADESVWYHGDIATAKVIQANLPWQVHAPWPALDLAFLLVYYRELPFVNTDVEFTTAGRFAENPGPFFDRLGEDDHVFVKSTAADKTISGTCIDRADFVRAWDLLTFYEPPLDTPLLIARPRKIKAEARFIIVNKQVVTGSYYKTGGQGINLRATDHLIGIANGILQQMLHAGYDPAPSWVLDLAETDTGWEILEVGATSCCGLYACDTDAIIAALGAL